MLELSEVRPTRKYKAKDRFMMATKHVLSPLKEKRLVTPLPSWRCRREVLATSSDRSS